MEAKDIIQLVVYWLSPAVVVFSVFFCVYAVQGGSFNPWVWRVTVSTSLSDRTYLAFEQGEGWARRFELQAEHKFWWSDGRLVARQLYGTPEQNSYSVLRAIARNPLAQLRRITWNVRDFFLSWNDAYQGRGLPLLMFSTWGLFDLLVYRKKLGVVILSLLFPTLAYFLVTFWNPRYIMSLSPLWVFLSFYALYRILNYSYSLKFYLLLLMLSGSLICTNVWCIINYPINNVNFFNKWTPSIIALVMIILWILWLIWFLLRRSFSYAWKRKMVALISLFLTVCMFVIPSVNWGNSSEYFSYIDFSFKTARWSGVCYKSGNLDAVSLIWYARQKPVEITVKPSERIEAIMSKHQCSYFLLVGSEAKLPVDANLNTTFESEHQLIRLVALKNVQ